MMGLDEIVAANEKAMQERGPYSDDIDPAKYAFAVKALRTIAEAPAEKLISDPPTLADFTLYTVVSTAAAAMGFIEDEFSEEEANRHVSEVLTTAMSGAVALVVSRAEAANDNGGADASDKAA